MRFTIVILEIVGLLCFVDSKHTLSSYFVRNTTEEELLLLFTAQTKQTRACRRAHGDD